MFAWQLPRAAAAAGRRPVPARRAGASGRTLRWRDTADPMHDGDPLHASTATARRARSRGDRHPARRDDARRDRHVGRHRRDHGWWSTAHGRSSSAQAAQPRSPARRRWPTRTTASGSRRCRACSRRRRRIWRATAQRRPAKLASLRLGRPRTPASSASRSSGRWSSWSSAASTSDRRPVGRRRGPGRAARLDAPRCRRRPAGDGAAGKRRRRLRLDGRPGAAGRPVTLTMRIAGALAAVLLATASTAAAQGGIRLDGSLPTGQTPSILQHVDDRPAARCAGAARPAVPRRGGPRRSRSATTSARGRPVILALSTTSARCSARRC